MADYIYHLMIPKDGKNTCLITFRYRRAAFHLVGAVELTSVEIPPGCLSQTRTRQEITGC